MLFLYKILKGKEVIADKVKYCGTFFSRLKGLMFSRRLKKGEALILEAVHENVLETTIHMFFVFFPIDVIWLNKNKKVVDIKRNVKPFMLWISPRDKAKYIIELPKGITKSIKIGDKIEIIYNKNIK